MDKPRVIAILPARLKSSLLPEKLLMDLNGEMVLSRTYHAVQKCELVDEIWIFCDDQKIVDACSGLTKNILLTSAEAPNSTHRIGDNIHRIESKWDYIVNVRSDGPYVDPVNVDFAIRKHLELMSSPSSSSSNIAFTTVHQQLEDTEYLCSPRSVKVVVNSKNEALLYSRSVVPSNKGLKFNPHDYPYQSFTGIYVYNEKALKEYLSLPKSLMQDQEDVEQLRFLDAGYKIMSYPAPHFNEIYLNDQNDLDYLTKKYAALNEAGEKKKKPLYLDCTVRDGGYTNFWRFRMGTVSQLYNTLCDARVDYMEIGFRNCDKMYNRSETGVWRHLDEATLRKAVPKKQFTKLAVMVDCTNFNPDIIPPASETYVELMRIAFHKEHQTRAMEICALLLKQGYQVAINAMATQRYSPEELEALVKATVDVGATFLYVADSYGCLTPMEVRSFYDRIRKLADAADPKNNLLIGIHLHNNMGMANANAMVAAECGYDIIDSTILGTGRGAGNAHTEVLACMEPTLRATRSLFRFCDEYRDLYRATYNRNTLLQVIGGYFKAHPNYVLKLQEWHHLSCETVWNVLDTLSKNGHHELFNSQHLTKIVESIE